MGLFRNNEFYLKTKAGVEIRIPINNKVSIITGDSATGKTKMIRCLKDVLKDKSEVTAVTINLDDVLVCMNAEEFYSVVKENITDKIIFIDRFDTVDINKIIDFLRESNNVFVICAHKEIPKCGYSIESMLGLFHDGKCYEAKRLFSSPSDFMNNKEVLI